MIKRYNVELRLWEFGYWVDNTRFFVVTLSKDLF